MFYSIFTANIYNAYLLQSNLFSDCCTVHFRICLNQMSCVFIALDTVHSKWLLSMFVCVCVLVCMCARMVVYLYLYVHRHVAVLQDDREETVDLCEDRLQISMLVKELPPSLAYSGYEELEEMMFFSL